MATYLVINEQHSLMAEQEELLKAYSGYKTILAPAEGWSREQIDVAVEEFEAGDTIIFASPIPYMIKRLASALVEVPDMSIMQDLKFNVKVFHNDKREKIELPNGKIINKVAQTGWEII